MTHRSWMLMTALVVVMPTTLAAQATPSSPAPPPAQAVPPSLAGDNTRQEVEQAERAFARTMVDRDHAAFAAMLADEARFVGDARILRGKDEIAAGWKRFFEGTPAPFSWEPELVEVLPSGSLAMTSGPVRNPAGQRVGTFTSVWRKDADGKWRVVFDRGCPPCECK